MTEIDLGAIIMQQVGGLIICVLILWLITRPVRNYMRRRDEEGRLLRMEVSKLAHEMESLNERLTATPAEEIDGPH